MVGWEGRHPALSHDEDGTKTVGVHGGHHDLGFFSLNWDQVGKQAKSLCYPGALRRSWVQSIRVLHGEHLPAEGEGFSTLPPHTVHARWCPVTVAMPSTGVSQVEGKGQG